MLRTPGVDELAGAVGALRERQHDGAPAQLHPGDLGWFWRLGPEATAAAVRTWSRAGRILAVGLLDGPRVLRLGLAPDAADDGELARRIVDDVTRPERGVLPAGDVSIEARSAGALTGLLRDAGWEDDDPWTPLSRDLADPVPDRGVRVEPIGADRAGVRAAVQRAAFDVSTFTEERWQVMAAGPLYRDARCLVAHDDTGTAVAAATVWSAGPGRPGLLEPVGVHGDHRGHGYGTAIVLAAAAALRELGSSSATVCTESSRVGAVATYAAAGFRQHPDVPDLRRSA